MLGGRQYFCGEAVTYSDFAVYHHLDLVKVLEPSVVEREGSLVSWMGRVESYRGWPTTSPPGPSSPGSARSPCSNRGDKSSGLGEKIWVVVLCTDNAVLSYVYTIFAVKESQLNY